MTSSSSTAATSRRTALDPARERTYRLAAAGGVLRLSGGGAAPTWDGASRAARESRAWGRGIHPQAPRLRHVRRRPKEQARGGSGRSIPYTVDCRADLRSSGNGRRASLSLRITPSACGTRGSSMPIDESVSRIVERRDRARSTPGSGGIRWNATGRMRAVEPVQAFELGFERSRRHLAKSNT